jgi:hypothetical protein
VRSGEPIVLKAKRGGANRPLLFLQTQFFIWSLPTASPRTSGDNPAIVLITAIGRNLPASVVVNEFTTVASAWTHAQFLNCSAIEGPSLGLRFAAGNVANFVDIATGSYGGAILGPLNNTQRLRIRPSADSALRIGDRSKPIAAFQTIAL